MPIASLFAHAGLQRAGSEPTLSHCLAESTEGDQYETGNRGGLWAAIALGFSPRRRPKADFESAIRRFDPSRPSQAVRRLATDR